MDWQSNMTGLSLLCWNIEGLNGNCLEARTESVSVAIERLRPQVVCLQEVIRSTELILRSRLGAQYDFHTPPDRVILATRGYYVIILVTKDRHFASRAITHFEPFQQSIMGRHLLSAELSLSSGRTIRVFTSHLESCQEMRPLRQAQLSLVWQRMLTDGQSDAIFCGDLNLCDSEVSELNGPPQGIADAWEALGSNPETQFTWCPKTNYNCAALVGNQTSPRRFDRLYFRQAGALTPVSFSLAGLEKVPNTDWHPSDHYAILVHFNDV